MPACNERFGGRRGVTRGTLYRYFESSVPVPTYANPRPTAKPPGVSRHLRTAQRILQAKKTERCGQLWRKNE